MKTRDLKIRMHEILRNRIIECEYPPGTMLNETHLCTELEVSRTPIREALALIEREGFVQIIPKKGIFVKDITLSNVLSIFQVRYEIEPVALRMAAPFLQEEKLLEFKSKFLGEEPDIRVAFRLDTAMHLFIIEHCGNSYIVDMMRKVFDENTRIVISSKQNQVKIHDARKEHVEIIDLLLNRKVKEAAKAMRMHIDCCKKAALDFFYSFTSPVDDYKTTYRMYLQRSEGVMI
jgi:DNA-binding GntR family transcriptional regulator